MRLVHEDGEASFLARDIDDGPPLMQEDSDGDGQDAQLEGELFGFLTPHPPDDADFTFDDRDEDYPETWLEFDAAGRPRLKRYYREARARRFAVAPDGRVGSGTRGWFLPGKFRLCLRYGNTQGGAARDRTRLASLSAEGRSSGNHRARGQRGCAGCTAPGRRWTCTRASCSVSPTTARTRRCRPDTSTTFCLSASVRAGFLGALHDAGSSGLRNDELGIAMQRTLGFDQPKEQIRAEWLLEPSLRGFNLQEAEGTLRQVLAYRVWFDQRRGWRYTNPNLEQLDIVRVGYLGIDELASDDELFRGRAPASAASQPRGS